LKAFFFFLQINQNDGLQSTPANLSINFFPYTMKKKKFFDKKKAM